MRRSIGTSLLTVLFVLAMGRAILLATSYVETSLQMDFAAFYSAGQADARGLSPYRNQVVVDVELWDGVERSEQSRFYYPPLVATLFRPWAALPYAVAKAGWTVLSLLCVLLSLAVTWRSLDLGVSLRRLLAVGLAVALFFPLVVHLERGQIDAVTLLLLVGAIALLQRGSAAADLTAGLAIAGATLLKLHCALLVPFLLLRGRFLALTGVAGGAAVLLLLSLALNGAGAVSDYVFEQLPRFGRFGTSALETELLDEAVFEPALGEAPPGWTVKDGQLYRVSGVQFVQGAGLPRLLQRILARLGLEVGLPLLSLLTLLVLFPPVAFGAIRSECGWSYWLAVLVVILLSAPLTWAMNTVWLLPVLLLLLRRPGRRLGTALCASGLLIAALPDQALVDSPSLAHLAQLEYVLAELLVLSGLLVMGRPEVGRPEPASGKPPVAP